MDNRKEPSLKGFIVSALALHTAFFVTCAMVAPVWAPDTKPIKTEITFKVTFDGGDGLVAVDQEKNNEAAKNAKEISDSARQINENAKPEIDSTKQAQVDSTKQTKTKTAGQNTKTIKQAQDEDYDAQINKRVQGIKDRVKNSGQGGLTAGASSQGANRVNPEMECYYKHIQEVIRNNWVKPMNTDDTMLVSYKLTIEPDGRISSAVLVSSSANQEYDLSVTRALNISSFQPLPPVFGEGPHSLIVKMAASDLY